jgi:prophage antirepressor-like protein
MSVFSFDNITFNLINYGTSDKPFYKAKDIALFLGFKNRRRVIRDNVYDSNKFTFDNITPKGGTNFCPPFNHQKNTIYINQPGLYQLIFISKMPYSEPFQKWVFNNIIPSITQHNKNIDNKIIKSNLTFNIQNEFDLHTQIINFLKVQYPTILLTVCNPELSNDTYEKRKKCFLLGYQAGTFDILINNLHKNYSGFAIELKSPTGLGVISENQYKMKQIYQNNNFKTLISNDYNKIIFEIIQYMNDTRILCIHCKRRFKNIDSLNNHFKYFHKIIQQACPS